MYLLIRLFLAGRRGILDATQGILSVMFGFMLHGIFKVVKCITDLAVHGHRLSVVSLIFCLYILQSYN